MMLDYKAGILIVKINQIAGRIVSKKLKKYNTGINPSQGRILFALWNNNCASIRELSVETSLGKSALTSMLNRLEDAGYVKRVPSEKDRRKIMIGLTGKNKKLKNIFIHVTNELTHLFYQGFEEAEITEYENSMKRVFHNLAKFEAINNSNNSSNEYVKSFT